MGFLATATSLSNPAKLYAYGAVALAIIAGGLGVYARVQYLQNQVKAEKAIVQAKDQEIGRLQVALEQAKGTIQIVKEKGDVQIVRVQAAASEAVVIHNTTAAQVIDTLTAAETEFSRAESLKRLRELKWEEQ